MLGLNDADDGHLGLAERLLAAIDWSDYRQLGGDPATEVGELLRSLLESTLETADTTSDALENVVAVQANLYSAAEPAVSVLAASLVDPRPRWVRISVLELMYLVLSGAPVAEEIECGNGALLDRCRTRVRESLWLIVRVALADSTCYEVALEVLDLVDPGGLAAALVRSSR